MSEAWIFTLISATLSFSKGSLCNLSHRTFTNHILNLNNQSNCKLLYTKFGYEWKRRVVWNNGFAYESIWIKNYSDTGGKNYFQIFVLLYLFLVIMNLKLFVCNLYIKTESKLKKKDTSIWIKNYMNKFLALLKGVSKTILQL